MRIKLKGDSSLDDIELCIYQLESESKSEIDFGTLLRIASLLDIELCKGKAAAKGSGKRFKHISLIGHPEFPHGVFTIHTLHGGGQKLKVTKRDFVKRFRKPVLLIINELKKTK